MLTDEQLYGRYLEGDKSAIDELLVRHKDGLSRFIYGIVRNPDDAEDLMMDTFAMVLFKRVHFRNESSFKTWLYGIGRNLANNYLRKHKNESLDELDESVMPDSGFDVDSTVLERERNRELYNAMKKLKPEYLQALYLSYFVQMNAAEIAKVMKRSAKQVYNLLDRGKKQLKEIMDEPLSI